MLYILIPMDQGQSQNVEVDTECNRKSRDTIWSHTGVENMVYQSDHCFI